MESISPEELQDRLKGSSNLQLVDVREPHEWPHGTLPGALLIPMGEIGARMHELDNQKPTVLICRSGKRSAEVAEQLSQAGFTCLNLTGGMNSYADLDSSIQKY